MISFLFDVFMVSMFGFCLLGTIMSCFVAFMRLHYGSDVLPAILSGIVFFVISLATFWYTVNALGYIL